jgi:hypothetical protein
VRAMDREYGAYESHQAMLRYVANPLNVWT